MFTRQRNAKQVAYAHAAAVIRWWKQGRRRGAVNNTEDSCLCIFYLIRVSGLSEERTDLGSVVP